jgi:hypothetical protein
VQADCASGQVCAPVPAAPFSTGVCIAQPGAATTCPSAYPIGPQVFYTGVDDQRGCAACQCVGPGGGACLAPSPAVTACQPASGSWDAPGTCSSITGPEEVKLAAPATLVDAGSCAASGGAPSGDATPTGATSFCCAP